ncbi:MAG: hypothetical protein XD95_0377 [Microgenomates bacterium 39_7]|nr:MAG: hypothetical protein XD95_0377 [Microgenomates bacterium 39_7]
MAITPPKPQKPPLPPKPDQNPPKVNTKTANINQPKEGKTSSPQNKKRKNIFIIAALIFLAAAAVAGALFLLQERQDIRKGATVTCPPGDNGQPGQACSSLGKCDVAGGCNPGCCNDNNDCPSGQTCSIPNGYCRSGQSCNDSGTEEYHKACRNEQCVEVAGPGPDQCSSNSDCQNDDGGGGGEEAQTCIEAGDSGDPGVESQWCINRHETKTNATWSCEPNSPDSGDDGCLQICKSGYVWKSDFSQCIETDGESGQLICQRANNHEIKITNNTGTTIPYEKIVFRGCPYDSADCQGSQYRTEYVQPSINAGQSKTESTAPAHCETIQLDIRSLSSQYSCLTADGQPWDGGVAFAIDHHWDETCEDKPPTATITQPEYSCNCHTIKIYDQDKNLVAADDLENLKAGDLIYIGVVANNGYYPNYPVTKARIRVNRNYWLEQDITEEKIDHDNPPHLTEFIKPYTIPEGILNFKVEAEIYLDAPGSIGNWY